MSYFKFLVIIFSIFLSFDLIAKKDFLNVNGFHLSKDDLTIFKQSLKEGDKAKWARTLTISKGLKIFRISPKFFLFFETLLILLWI